MDHVDDNNEQKLADRGWAELRVALDRELPVRRKRRRFFWLWWLVPALLTGGTVAWWQQDADSPALTPVTPPVVRQENQAPVALAPANEQLPTSVVEKNRVAPSAVRPESPASGDILQSINPSPGKTTPTRHLSVPPASAGVHAPEAISPKRIVPEQVTTRTTTSPAATLPYNGSPKASALNPPTETSPAEAGGTGWATSLPLLPITWPALAGLRPLFPDVEINTNTKPAPPPVPERRWSFGLTAGASLLESATVPGGLVGVTADFRLSPKWGLRSGLWYGRERLPSTSSATVALPVAVLYDTTSTGYVIVEDITFDTPGTSNGGFSPPAAGRVEAPVIRLHRLEMPLLVWWQPLRQWRLYGGGTVARTLWLETGRQKVVDSSSNASVDAGDFNSRKALNRLATREAERWQLGILGGLGFQPTRRWELNFFGQYLPRNTTASVFSTDVAGSSSGAVPQTNITTIRQNTWRLQLNATWFF